MQKCRTRSLDRTRARRASLPVRTRWAARVAQFWRRRPDDSMKNIAYIFSLVILVLTVACTTPGRPPSSRIVGGGAQIDWQAPEDGTAVLVERITGKIVITRTLKAHDDPFTFNLTVAGDVELVKKALGTVPPSPEADHKSRQSRQGDKAGLRQPRSLRGGC